MPLQGPVLPLDKTEHKAWQAGLSDWVAGWRDGAGTQRVTALQEASEEAAASRATACQAAAREAADEAVQLCQEQHQLMLEQEKERCDSLVREVRDEAARELEDAMAASQGAAKRQLQLAWHEFERDKQAAIDNALRDAAEKEHLATAHAVDAAVASACDVAVKEANTKAQHERVRVAAELEEAEQRTRHLICHFHKCAVSMAHSSRW